MNSVIRLAIVDPDADVRYELKTALSNQDLVWLEAECGSYGEAVEQLSEGRPNVVIVGVDRDPEESVKLIRSLSRSQAAYAVCAVSRAAEGQLILRTMRAGAKEFITLPVVGDDLIASLHAISGLEDESGEGGNRCRTIAVAGATGGIGSTSIAVNLASILAQDPCKSVVLVDLDLTLGDADVFLDVMHDHTLVDLAANVSRLDFDLLRRSLTKLDSGLYLLPRPVDLGDVSLVTVDVVRRVLGLLKASFSHVILDISKGYNDLDVAALEYSDAILMVTQLNLPCLRNIVRLMKSFRELGRLDEKVKIVVNRSGLDDESIRLKKAQEIIRREVFWRVPNDYRLMVEVSNNGVPLIQQAPRAEITQSLLTMADALCDEAGHSHNQDLPSAVTASQLSKWFSLWPGALSRFSTSAK